MIRFRFSELVMNYSEVVGSSLGSYRFQQNPIGFLLLERYRWERRNDTRTHNHRTILRTGTMERFGNDSICEPHGTIHGNDTAAGDRKIFPRRKEKKDAPQ